MILKIIGQHERRGTETITMTGHLKKKKLAFNIGIEGKDDRAVEMNNLDISLKRNMFSLIL